MTLPSTVRSACTTMCLSQMMTCRSRKCTSWLWPTYGKGSQGNGLSVSPAWALMASSLQFQSHQDAQICSTPFPDIFRAHSLLDAISKRSGLGLDVRLELSVCSLLLGNPAIRDRTVDLTAPDKGPTGATTEGLAGGAVQVMVSTRNNYSGLGVK